MHNGEGGPEVIVADGGPGIPESDRERVLERFVRLDSSRSTPGNGLGLSLVAAIARLHDAVLKLDDNAPGVTIRIRDRGGGIGPDVLPHIWGYSFTTFNESDDDVPAGWSGEDALSVISAASNGSSSIAGLGYGLPLSRAYAEYFGGGIAVQSLHGWGTDVYLRLKGVGKIV